MLYGGVCEGRGEERIEQHVEYAFIGATCVVVGGWVEVEGMVYGFSEDAPSDNPIIALVAHSSPLTPHLTGYLGSKPPRRLAKLRERERKRKKHEEVHPTRGYLTSRSSISPNHRDDPPRTTSMSSPSSLFSQGSMGEVALQLSDNEPGDLDQLHVGTVMPTASMMASATRKVPPIPGLHVFSGLLEPDAARAFYGSPLAGGAPVPDL